MLETLSVISLFQDFSSDQMALLDRMFERFFCPAGKVIFEQGDPARHLYLIVKGNIEIRYKPYDGPALTLTRLHAGEVFGWSAVVGRAKYTSSVFSETPIEAIRIRGDTLWILAKDHPEIGVTIINRLAQIVSPRWNNAHAQIQSLLNSNRKD